MTSPYGERIDFGDLGFEVARQPAVSEARIHVSPRERAIDAVIGALAAWPRGVTDAIDVNFTSADRRLAVRVVNALVTAFQDENARSMQQQATRRRVFLEEQLRQNDLELRQAQDALITYRSQRHVYSSADRIAAERSSLLQLETRRQEMDSDRRLFRSMLERAQQARGENRMNLLEALATAPGLGDNAQIAQLRAQLLQHRANRTELESEFTELHPRVRQVAETIARTQEQLASAIDTHLTTLDARITALDDLRAQVADRLEVLPAAEATEDRLVQAVETARSLGAQLRSEYQRARTSEAVEAGNVTIVNLASDASSGDANRRMKVAIGAMLGIVLGTGLALLFEALNGSIRQTTELDHLLKLSPLGLIPNADTALPRAWPARLLPRSRRAFNGNLGNGKDSQPAVPDVIAALRVAHSASEAYRSLRTSLLFSESAKDVQSIVVTSACIGDGKTTVAANLAVSFAQQGYRVVLIDADLRRPRLHELFRQTHAPGLSDLLHLSTGAAEAVRATSVDVLELIPCGTKAENPAELIGGDRMGRLLDCLKERYHYVVLDAPPVLAAADATVLAAKADGVLFVVRAGATHRDAAQQAVQQLWRVRARLIGAVLNDPDSIAPSYGRYYSYAYASDD